MGGHNISIFARYAVLFRVCLFCCGLGGYFGQGALHGAAQVIGNAQLCLADGVLDALGLAGTVCLDDRLCRAQQRCAADLLRVHHVLQIAQPAFYAKVAQLGHNALHKDVFQHAQQSTRHTLGQLQHHIAHKAVADDNVHQP